MAPALAHSIERFLASRIEGLTNAQIVDLVENTEGFSQETFSFDVVLNFHSAPSQRRSYVIKRKPTSGLLEPYDIEPEFRALHALSGCGLLSPPTPWYESDPAVLERPFYVMERLPGEVPVPAPNRDGAGPFDPSERTALAPQVVAELVRLHAVDWRQRGLDFLAPAPGEPVAARELRRWRERIERAGFEADPMLEYTLLWLERHLPADDELTLVHGDYRTGNFLVKRDGATSRLTGVLDWEMVHVGDPIEDLGWAVSRLWRAQGPYACCLAEPDELVRMYETTRGRNVDRARLRFYEVLSAVKMLAIMLTGIRAFLDGRTADLRMAIFDHQAAFLGALMGVELGIVPET
jgi:aminoglycoside phosphotransferase (APT) family kinase protein